MYVAIYYPRAFCKLGILQVRCFLKAYFEACHDLVDLQGIEASPY